MNRTVTPGRARWATRVRLATLALVALLSAHTAIYAAHFGLGNAFATAMSASGHDGWWLPAVGVVVVAGVFLLALTVGSLARLEWAVRSQRFDSPTPRVPRRHVPVGRRDSRRDYAASVLELWRVLLPLVIALFAIQENVELLIGGGRVAGLEVLISAELPLTLPVLAAVTLAVAALGALVRWRIAGLVARLARTTDRRRTVADAAAPRWRAIGALAPRRWMTDRLDAGRAPPELLRI